MANDDDFSPCPGCGKPTYPSEKPMMCLGAKWHPLCIKCTTCGIVLSMRSLESYEKKPYCSAHRPAPNATQTTVQGDFKVNLQANVVPKAARRQPGVDVTARQTFYAGPNQNLDQVGRQLHENKAAINPRGFTPDRPAAPNRTRAQGVNKLEGTTFNETSMTNKGSSAPGGSESDWSHSAQTESYDQGGYDQGGHDQGGYDQGGHDQGGYDQGGYDDQGGHDQGGHDQGGYDQGGYEEGGGEYQEGGYDQGGGEYQEGGYEHQEGEYQEGGYDNQYQEGEYQETY